MIAPKLSVNQIKIFSFILSFLLLLFISWNAVSNPDGILYMRAVDASMAQGWGAASSFFNWPFYVWALTVVAKIFHLSANGAALAFNATACGLLAVAFLQLLQSLELPSSKFFLAAIVFLMFPTLNNHRDSILRDFAYWALYLFSISHLLEFNKKLLLKNALYWLLFIVAAGLFRVEAFVFLCLAPLAVLWTHRSDGQGLSALVKLYAFPLALLVCGLIYTHVSETDLALGRLENYKAYANFFLYESWQQFHQQALELAYTFSPDFPPEYGMVFLLGGVTFYILFLNLRAFSLELAILWLWGRRCSNWRLPNFASAPIKLILCLNFVICFMFALRNGFLAERFLMGALLLLLLFIPFYLPAIWENIMAQSNSMRTRSAAVTMLVVLCLTTSVHGLVSFGHSKQYLREAADWIQTNTPINAVVYSSNFQLDYYAHRQGRPWNANFTDEQALADLAAQGWRNYDYLAIRIRGKNKAYNQKIVELIPASPIYQVTNDRGDGVLVFDVRGR